MELTTSSYEPAYLLNFIASSQPVGQQKMLFNTYFSFTVWELRNRAFFFIETCIRVQFQLNLRLFNRKLGPVIARTTSVSSLNTIKRSFCFVYKVEEFWN